MPIFTSDVALSKSNVFNSLLLKALFPIVVTDSGIDKQVNLLLLKAKSPISTSDVVYQNLIYLIYYYKKHHFLSL